MSDAGRLRNRLRALLADRSQAGSSLDRLCAAAATLLPVAGVTISVTTGPACLRPIAASDPATARLDDVQFTLGEGPCWEAVRDGRPVLVADLAESAGRRWPTFTATLLDAGMRSAYAFPIQIGAIRLGALGLLGTAPDCLGRDEVGGALVVADVAALTLVDAPVDAPVGTPVAPSVDRDERTTPAATDNLRAEVHQATGMVMAQLGVDGQQALLRLRAYAYAHDQTADDVARDVVARRLRFEEEMPR